MTKAVDRRFLLPAKIKAKSHLNYNQKQTERQWIIPCMAGFTKCLYTSKQDAKFANEVEQFGKRECILPLSENTQHMQLCRIG